MRGIGVMLVRRQSLWVWMLWRRGLNECCVVSLCMCGCSAPGARHSYQFSGLPVSLRLTLALANVRGLSETAAVCWLAIL